MRPTRHTVWCGEQDARVVERERPAPGKSRLAKLLQKLPAPQPHPVERRLREGDEVAGLTVLDVPGHSPGHVAYWRKSDRTLICGDVLFTSASPPCVPASGPRSATASASCVRRIATGSTLRLP
jgi:glyoxylase-like metal-dependent hydrolase (beta-lactamase superfamily II)